MLHIFCPHCGELRSEEEFHASGQAHIPRPLDPNACTDEEWGDYMFFRDNPRGLHHELWITPPVAASTSTSPATP
jgi:sarcosine oxidase subunit delta